ncbi:MAG: hypothetical protein V1875_04050 [Candidatus Altiarchaeota archaeon]
MRHILLACGTLGFASIVLQLALLREFLCLYNGNELTIGVVLGFWLLFTAIGCHIASCFEGDREKQFGWSLGLSAILSPLSVYLARTASAYFLVSGQSGGPHQLALAVASALAFFCMLNGAQITFASTLLARRGVGGTGFAYAADSLGSAFGGAVYTFFLVGLDPYRISYIAAFTLLFTMALVHRPLRPVAILLAALFAASMYIDVQSATFSSLYPGQGVLEQGYTRYGSIVVTRTGNQVNFYVNGLPASLQNDVRGAEETVHFALAQRQDARDILIIGGGMSGSVREALKYPAERIDVVEMDAEAFSLAGKYGLTEGLDDPRVNLIFSDGRSYVKSTHMRYDAVIVDMPPPLNAQLNRFYTRDFLTEASRIMNAGGVLSLKLPGGADYMSTEEKSLNAGIYRTLKTAFTEVVAFPAGSNVYVGSQSTMTYDVGRPIENEGIKTEYVNEEHLRGTITGERISHLMGAVSSGGGVNTDMKPIAYGEYLNYWYGQYGMKAGARYVAAALIAIFFLYWMRLTPVKSNLFAAGFTGMALEIVVMLIFQSSYGYVYDQLGVIVAAYMLGLFAGAHMLRGTKLRFAVLCVAAFSMMLPSLSRFAPSVLYPAFTFAAGAMCGAILAQAAAHPDLRKASGSVLGLDFTGAFAGCILTSLLFIPAVGLDSMCYMVAALNLVGYVRLRLET